MGKTRRFIDKKNAVTYNLVHRSQQDAAYETTGVPSEFVLVPSRASADADRQHVRKDKRMSAYEAAAAASLAEEQREYAKFLRTGELSVKGDHITALGLPNDGYDYERHMKAMGEGTFVSRQGRLLSSRGAAGGAGGGDGGGGMAAVLPSEALPSEEQLDRQLESITISEDVMDDDIRGAIFGDLEDVEELDDDFVLQAAAAGEEGGDDGGNGGAEAFDFDAHVARLIAASEQRVGIGGRGGRKVVVGRGGKAVGGGGGGGMGDDDEEGSDLDEFDMGLLVGELENIARAGSGGGGEGDSGGGDGGANADGGDVEAAFELALKNYDSDDWGGLESDDEQLRGPRDPETDKLANQCFDEFLEEHKNFSWLDGVAAPAPKPRGNASGGGGAAVSGGGSGGSCGGGGGGRPCGGEEEDPISGGPRLGKLRGLGALPDDAASPAVAPAAAAAVVVAPVAVDSDGENDGTEDEDDADTAGQLQGDFAYLRRAPQEQWDCETIVSTYSTLDNHPTKLGLGGVGDGGGGGRRRRRGRGAASSVVSGTAGSAGPAVLSTRPTLAAARAARAAPALEPRAEAGGGGASSGGSSNEAARTSGVGAAGGGGGGANKEVRDQEGSSSGEEGGGDGDKSDVDAPEDLTGGEGGARVKGESAEERRVRKARVKEEKRAARERKRGSKKLFREGAAVAARDAAHPGAAQRSSVFVYS